MTSLDMADNGLGEDGAKCVAEMLSENTFVTELVRASLSPVSYTHLTLPTKVNV